MGALAKKLLGKGKYNSNGYNNHDYNSGMYNGYNYRPGSYNNIQGRTCSNYIEYNGVVFGQFRCPIEGNRYDETECCGHRQEQYCCSPHQAMLEKRNNYNQAYRGNTRSSGMGTVIFILILLLILIALGLWIFNLKKKKYVKVDEDKEDEKAEVVA